MEKRNLPPIEELLRHTEFIRALAFSLVGDAQVAEDVVQDTLTAALERPPKPGNLRGWLATVARNRVRSHQRAGSRRHRREQAVARSEADRSMEQMAETLEVQRKLVDAVAALKEPLRSTLMLRFYEGLDQADIAERLGISERTVRRRVKDAVARLRVRLDATHGGDRSKWALALAPLLPGSRNKAPLASLGLFALRGGTELGRAPRFAAAVAFLAASALALYATVGTNRGGMASRETAVLTGEARPIADGDTDPAPGAAPDESVFRVRVRRKRDGAPLAGQRVSLTSGKISEVAHTVVTDQEGLARFPELDLRARLILVEGGGYSLTLAGICDAHAEERLVLLSEGVTLRGRVRDAATGDPVAGAKVLIGFDRTQWLKRDIETNADGVFEYSALEPWREMMLWIWAPGYGHHRASVVPALDTEPTEFLLGGTMLRGRVLDESGSPLQGAKVYVAKTYDTRLRGPRPLADTLPIVSDAEGGFSWRALEPGRYDVVVLTEGPARGAHKRIEIARGESEPFVDVNVRQFPYMKIRVVDDLGQPVRVPLDQLRTFPKERGTYTWSIGSADDGMSVLIGTERFGAFTVMPDPPGHVIGRGDVVLSQPGQEFTVQVERGAYQEGTVSGSDGNALRGITVEFRAKAPGTRTTTRTATTDRRGEFRLDGLWDGPGRLRVIPRSSTGYLFKNVEEFTPSESPLAIVLPSPA
ncbi:MAG: sigma-70 family RNA polymerase sigma factor, partial [Planctomycetota bacterium]